MNISPISLASNVYGNIQKSVKSNNDNKLCQSINLEAEKNIIIKTIDDKTFNMKIFQDGGFEWSGCLRIKAYPAGSTVTAERAAAAYASKLYTENEYKQNNDISAVVHYLYLMIEKGFSTDYFNNFIKNRNITQDEVNFALDSLGLNTSEPFTINGRKFIFDSETLKNVE